MGYENAKSTRLLASRCCVCARPLRDAKSVELGIGPVCRTRYGHDLNVSEAARAQANALVQTVAVTQEMTPAQHAELLSLGFSALAAKLAERLLETLETLGTVTVTTDTNPNTSFPIVVEVPYNEDALPAWRKISCWHSATKTRRVAAKNKGKLWALLQEFHNGCTLKSDKGETVIGSNEPPSKPEVETDFGNDAEYQMAVEQAAEEAEANLAVGEQLELPVPKKCTSRNCTNGWIYWNGSEYPCSACSDRAKWAAEVEKQEAAKEARQAAQEDEEDDSWTDGPPPGSWAATARMMAAGDNSGFDWDAWKDDAKMGEW